MNDPTDRGTSRRAGLAAGRARVIVGVLTEPLIFQRLVVDAGWTIEEYADWLERSATAALLPT